MTQILYHGSFSIITDFWPLSHFGSEKAAKSTAKSKNEKKKLGKTVGYLYCAQVSLGDRIFRLSTDIGTPRPIGYVMELLGERASEHFDFAAFCQQRDELQQVYGPGQRMRGDHANQLQAREFVANLFTAENYTSLDYVNVIEDPEHVSYVILRGAQVQIVSRTEFQLADV